MYIISSVSGRRLGLLSVGLLVASCSNPREDVRITLCKGMVESQLGASDSIAWKKQTAEPQGYDHALIRIEYSLAGKGGHAECYYSYDAAEDNAMNQANPMAAYATYPNKMTLAGRDLSKAAIADAVKYAMLKQGAEFADRIKQRGAEISGKIKKQFE